MKRNVYKHIWEGWRVCDFIEALLPQIGMNLKSGAWKINRTIRSTFPKW